MANKTGTPWDSHEIDLIISDYFAMRTKVFSGQPLVKSHHYAALENIIQRSKKSIEFKHQNISAVLETLCEPWIPGLAPMRNFQKALIEGVERFLDKGVPLIMPDKRPKNLADSNVIFLEKAPEKTMPILPDNPTLKHLVRKFDPAARDARNRDLGARGEEVALLSEHARLRAAGREDLARKVRWVSKEDGDGAGYDILSYSETGNERFLEVKTTTGHKKTPFYISSNEKQFSEECPTQFRLYRLYNFANKPKAFAIEPPLDNHVVLQATQFRASFN